jgi:hypothetical protein
VGAAIAQVSGEADQVFRELARDEAIAAARGIAEDRAVQAGAARASLKTVDVEDMPIAYLPPICREMPCGCVFALPAPSSSRKCQRRRSGPICVGAAMVFDLRRSETGAGLSVYRAASNPASTAARLAPRISER